jgi:hypothetical protein
MFTRASTRPYPEPDQSSPYHPVLSLLWSFLILSTHLHIDLRSSLFLSGFRTNNLYAFLLSHIRVTCPSHFILLDLIIVIILGEEYKSRSSSLCSFLWISSIRISPQSQVRGWVLEASNDASTTQKIPSFKVHYGVHKSSLVWTLSQMSTGRSQWPRGLRHELSSPAPTLR